MLKKALLSLLALTVLTMLVLPVTAQGNLLRDPGFEGTYTNRGRADFNVPEAWGVWFTEQPRTETWMNLQPVAFPHNGPGPDPVEGRHAFNFNKGFATYTAAIYQQVAVPQGENVTGSAYGQLHTCNLAPGSTTCGSAIESGAYMRVGIDPNGGTNPFDSDVVWSGNAMPHDRWENIVVSATATGPQVTLFLFTTQMWPAELNSSYWDASSLSIGGAGGVAAGGNPAQPAATPIPTAPPVASFVTTQPPQADGSIIHTVQPGDTLDAIAFAYGTTRQQLLDMNPELGNGRFLLVGQQLLVQPPGSVEQPTEEVPAPTLEVPDTSGSSPVPETSGSAPFNLLESMRILPDGSVAYIVQEGDTPESIAAAASTTIEDLLALNGFASAAELVAGEEIVVRPPPGGATNFGPTISEEVTAEPVELVEPEVEATPALDIPSDGTTAEETTNLTPENAPPAPLISITNGVVPAMDVADMPAQVCVLVFNDVNQNRLQEVGEAMLAGGAVMLIKDNQLFDDYTTTGENEPYCFSDLPEGDYLISAFSPEGFGLTTPSQLLVRPAPGWIINVAFGAAEGVSPQIAPFDVPATPEGDGASGKIASSKLNADNPLMNNLSYFAFGLAGIVVLVGGSVTLVMRAR